MEYIAILFASSLAAYYIGQKIGDASRNLEDMETDALNSQVLNRLNILSVQLREMEARILNRQRIDNLEMATKPREATK